MVTLAVVISCIFSLDSTDGQSEITSISTATESRRSARPTMATPVNQEFWRLSRYLMIPVQTNAVIGITAGFTVQSEFFQEQQVTLMESESQCIVLCILKTKAQAQITQQSVKLAIFSILFTNLSSHVSHLECR